jgi:hypothetical protein
MSRHQSRRRRLYGRRLHELRERRERPVESAMDADVDAGRMRMAIPIVVDARTGESGAGLGLAAVALD